MPAIYIAGCNLQCLYCLNRDLVKRECPKLDARKAVFELRGALEPWIMVSGAEPLMDPKTLNLLFFLKVIGFHVALATNGTYFERLRRVVEDRLVDHVVMDIKAPLDVVRYAEISPVGVTSEVLGAIRSSIDFLKNYPWTTRLTHHFRTTVCGRYIGVDDVRRIAEYIGPRATYVLQYYTTHQTLDPRLAQEKYVVPYETLVAWAALLKSVVEHAYVSEV